MGQWCVDAHVLPGYSVHGMWPPTHVTQTAGITALLTDDSRHTSHPKALYYRDITIDLMFTDSRQSTCDIKLSQETPASPTPENSHLQRVLENRISRQKSDSRPLGRPPASGRTYIVLDSNFLPKTLQIQCWVKVRHNRAHVETGKCE